MIRLSLFLVLALATVAQAQVSEFVPSSLIALGALNPITGSAGSVLKATAQIASGTSPSYTIFVEYTGPSSVSATLTSAGFNVPISSSNVIGAYRLNSITIIESGGQTQYHRAGAILRLFYTAPGLPTVHNLNFSALDFFIVAPATVPPTPASIASQPANARVTVDQPATFSVGVTSATSFSVQWRKNGVPIAGAMNQQYTLARTTLADAGTYDAVVTNEAGSVTTSGATLTVDAGRVKNISVRIVVSNNGVLTAGFVLDTAKAVLVRGIGRSLEQFGVPAGTTMLNPRIEIYNAAGTVVAQNDDFAAGPALSAATTRAGAFGLTSAQDAALAVSLPAGAYTVQLRPVGGIGGDALVEMYDVD